MSDTAARIAEIADEPLTCESCQKQKSDDEMQMMGDCWICNSCYAEWKAEFDTCEHDWESPYYFDGDEGKNCRKCNGFVTHD